MTELIITTAKRQQMREDQRIAKEYRAMRAAHPGASASLIIRSIAASGNFKAKSFSGVRSSLIRSGEFNPTAKS